MTGNYFGVISINSSCTEIDSSCIVIILIRPGLEAIRPTTDKSSFYMRTKNLFTSQPILMQLENPASIQFILHLLRSFMQWLFQNDAKPYGQY